MLMCLWSFTSIATLSLSLYSPFFPPPRNNIKIPCDHKHMCIFPSSLKTFNLRSLDHLSVYERGIMEREIKKAKTSCVKVFFHFLNFPQTLSFINPPRVTLSGKNGNLQSNEKKEGKRKGNHQEKAKAQNKAGKIRKINTVKIAMKLPELRLASREIHREIKISSLEHFYLSFFPSNASIHAIHCVLCLVCVCRQKTTTAASM